MDEKKLEDAFVELIRRTVSTVPPDIKSALNEALRNESNKIARMQLKAILENIRMAEEKQLPVCQDTGILYFYVNLPKGTDVKNIKKAILNATARATREVPLRPNAVDPMTGKNSGDNIGVNVPWVEFKPSDQDNIEVMAFVKGGGADNMSVLSFISVEEGIEGVKKRILDAVLKAGGGPCPPVVLGIGIGGGAYIAMKLANRALIRPVTMRNNDPRVARLENEILKEINRTGIGVMGLGGDVTAIGVNIEVAHRHPASYPIVVLFNCYAVRRAKIVISRGEWWFE